LDIKIFIDSSFFDKFCDVRLNDIYDRIHFVEILEIDFILNIVLFRDKNTIDNKKLHHREKHVGVHTMDQKQDLLNRLKTAMLSNCDKVQIRKMIASISGFDELNRLK